MKFAPKRLNISNSVSSAQGPLNNLRSCSVFRNLSLALPLAICFGCAGSGDSGQTVFPDVTGINVGAQIVADGFTLPMQYLVNPADTSLAYVIEKGGIVKVLKNDVVQSTPALDISSTIFATGECGLLGIAVDPNYASNHYVYLHYNTDSPITTNVVRYTADSTGTTLSDPYPIISFANEQTTSHKGGSIEFGKDGYLYFATGDGASPEDIDNNAQNPQSYLGKLLRIDVSRDDFPSDATKNYAIPVNNPYYGSSTIYPEIYGVGLRNPFRCSFDPVTGGLFIADVGQDFWEEINYVPYQGARRNFGWRIREGKHPFMNNLPAFSTSFFDPFFEFDHTWGHAVVGGFIYRGSGLDPAFKGRYFFGDATLRKVASIPFSVQNGEATTVTQSEIADHTGTINTALGAAVQAPVSISPDKNGEVMVVDLYRGQLLRLTR